MFCLLEAQVSFLGHRNPSSTTGSNPSSTFSTELGIAPNIDPVRCGSKQRGKNCTMYHEFTKQMKEIFLEKFLLEDTPNGAQNF